MNFLYRTAQPVVPELPRIPEQDHHKDGLQKPATTLEGLIADDPYQPSVSIEDGASNNGVGEIGGDAASLDSKSPVPQGKHNDVLDGEGWITIPKSWCPLTCLSLFSLHYKYINVTVLFANVTTSFISSQKK